MPKRREKTVTVEDLDSLKDEITKPLREQIERIQADLEILHATSSTGGLFLYLLQGTLFLALRYLTLLLTHVQTPVFLLFIYYYLCCFVCVYVCYLILV